jgi:hypothetical protein
MSRIACRDLRPRFDLWLDGGLPSSESEAIGEHLAACAGCAAFFAEEVRLAGVLEEAVRLAPAAGVPAPLRRLRLFRVLTGAAAASLLFCVGFGFGRTTADDEAFGGLAGAPPEDAAANMVAVAPEEWGVFMPNDAARASLGEAERLALSARLGRLESQRIKYELESAARRRSEQGPIDVAAVVRELRRHLSEAGAAGETRDRRCEVGRRIRAAGRLLASDRTAGAAALRGWLAEATDENERAAAIRLLGTVAGAGALPELLAEAERGPAREAAVDGLGRIGDDAARALLQKIAEAPSTSVDLRSRALASLHRLGEATAAGRLIALAEKNDDPGLRRRIVYALAARPTHDVGAELPKLANAAGFDAADRRLLAEMVAGTGVEGARTLSERLRF